VYSIAVHVLILYPFITHSGNAAHTFSIDNHFYLGCRLHIQTGFSGAFSTCVGKCQVRVKWYFYYLFPDNTIIGKSPFTCSWMGNTRYYYKVPWRFMPIVGVVKN